MGLRCFLQHFLIPSGPKGRFCRASIESFVVVLPCKRCSMATASTWPKHPSHWRMRQCRCYGETVVGFNNKKAFKKGHKARSSQKYLTLGAKLGVLVPFKKRQNQQRPFFLEKTTVCVWHRPKVNSKKHSWAVASRFPNTSPKLLGA